MFEQDYIMRMVNQLGRFAAAILRLRDNKEYTSALDSLDDAYDEILGISPAMLNRLDVSSARAMLSHQYAVAAYARLLQLEAGICEKTGMQSDAEQKYRRALIMLLESFMMGEKITKDDRKLLSDLVPKVRTEELPEDYGRILKDVKCRIKGRSG